MTYAIKIEARTNCGEKLGSVHLRNAPELDKLIRIREGMMVNGWDGRPVIMMYCGDHHVAFTGSHRISAAQGLGNIIEAVMLPELTSDEYDVIDSAYDDDGLLAAFKQIASDRGDDSFDEIVSIMDMELSA